jgi:hypothetical protein
MTPEMAYRILAWWYSETDVYIQEHCEWFAPASFGHLHFTVAEFITSQLDEFYSGFSEWFNLAEYPDVLEQLEEPEVAVFLKAAGAPHGTDFESIQEYDCFSGLCAVIRRRLDQRSLDQLKLAAELFNWTIEFGLFLCDTTGHATIKVGSAADVAPYLLGRILSRLPDDSRQNDLARQVPPSDFEQRFLPLAPVLTMLDETIESAGWVQNQLALRLVFWVAEMYKAQVENESL